tara:strand:- start:1569 stop:1829 length:261 start_codon:yes stop_codon:yes gene_type:complete
MSDCNRAVWIGEDHRGNRWEVIRYSDALPNLIRFLKYTTNRKLLDQVADWDGADWSGKRWMPRRPVVPDEVRLRVEELLQRSEVGR